MRPTPRCLLAAVLLLAGASEVRAAEGDAGSAVGTQQEETPAAEVPRLGRARTLHECITIALRQHLDVRTQRAVFAKSGYEVSSARASFLPTLTVSTSRGEDSRTDTVGLTQSSPWGTSVTLSASQRTGDDADQSSELPQSGSVSVSQSLLRGATITEGLAWVRQAGLNRDAAEQRLERLLQDVVYEVRTRYYDVARLMETVKVRRQAVARARRLLEEAAFKRDRGMVTKLDYANAVIQLADRQAAHVSTEKQLEDALDGLRESLDIPFEEEISIEPISLDVDREITVDDEEGTVSVAAPDGPAGASRHTVIFRPALREYRKEVEYALEMRPDFRAARFELDAVRLEVARKRGQMRHDLRLSASYSASGTASDDLLYLHDENDWSASLVLTWPFGRIGRRNDYQKALLELEVKEISVERFARSIRKELLRLFRRLEETEANILNYARKINAAADALESAKFLRERGLIKYWEVTARESDLLDAQTSFINAYLDYQKHLAGLDRARGRPVAESERAPSVVAGGAEGTARGE